MPFDNPHQGGWVLTSLGLHRPPLSFYDYSCSGSHEYQEEDVAFHFSAGFGEAVKFHAHSLAKLGFEL